MIGGLLLVPLLCGMAMGQATESPAVPGARSLEQFGDVSTPEAAAKTLAKAIQTLKSGGGGVLIIPTGVSEELVVRNRSQSELGEPGVTIIDFRDGAMKVYVAPLGNKKPRYWSGLTLERELNLGQHSMGQWGWTSGAVIQNNIVSGASSYMGALTDPVKAGKDRRAYVDQIRGIWVGQLLAVRMGWPAKKSRAERIIVKRIGWDPERRRNYFVADFEFDHDLGTGVDNKHMVTDLTLSSLSNCDNQTGGALGVHRRHFAVGDQFVVSALLEYTSDVNCGFGDEGGIVFTGDVYGNVNGFYSTVESVDWPADTLVYAPGGRDAITLSTSRPLINMNKKKWITAGQVRVVSPHGTYKGRRNRNRNGGPGKVYAFQGGLILAPKECGWTDEIIGRYFALTDPSEMILPGERTQYRGPKRLRPKRPVYRWYRIREHHVHEDGTHQIKILRVRWSATAAGAPRLFDDGNYTQDGHERPMNYCIAPGAMVYDVSEGWLDTRGPGRYVTKDHPRKLRVVPTGDRGTSFDFQPGDPIEQPVGPDPWQPRLLRLRHSDQMPDTMAGCTIDIRQNGRVQVRDGMRFNSRGRKMNDLPKRKDKKPPYGTLLKLMALSEIGIDFDADVTDAAIYFRQPYDRVQPIRWRRNRAGSNELTVPVETGTFTFAGGDIDTSGHGLQRVGGLSGGEKPARNLRGIAVAVTEGATKLTVKFPMRESDEKYAVSVTPTWMTPYCVPARTNKGFTIRFGAKAPAGATLDWIIVR